MSSRRSGSRSRFARASRRLSGTGVELLTSELPLANLRGEAKLSNATASCCICASGIGRFSVMGLHRLEVRAERMKWRGLGSIDARELKIGNCCDVHRLDAIRVHREARTAVEMLCSPES